MPMVGNIVFDSPKEVSCDTFLNLRLGQERRCFLVVIETSFYFVNVVEVLLPHCSGFKNVTYGKCKCVNNLSDGGDIVCHQIHSTGC